MPVKINKFKIRKQNVFSGKNLVYKELHLKKKGSAQRQRRKVGSLPKVRSGLLWRCSNKTRQFKSSKKSNFMIRKVQSTKIVNQVISKDFYV